MGKKSCGSSTKKNKKIKPLVPEKKLSIPEELADEMSERLGDIVPERQKKQIIEKMGSLFFKAEMYQGPFPHPEHAIIYEQICPGFLNRTLTMAEKAQDSHIQRDEEITKHQIDDAKRGMRYGVVTFLGLVIATLICIFTGHEKISFLFLGAGCLGVISQLMWGRGINRKNNQRHQTKESLIASPAEV